MASSRFEFALVKTDVTAPIGPKTGIPSMQVPIRFLSSSIKALTLPKIFFLFISSAIVCPANPAPMM